MIQVALSPAPVGPITDLVEEVLPESIGDALDLAVARGQRRPLVRHGVTLDLWEALPPLGAHDLSVARSIEPHLHALTILDQAGASQLRGGTWGGISIAACWFGGAVWLRSSLLHTARRPCREEDDILLTHLGLAEARPTEERTARCDAEALVDSGDQARLRARRVRSTVARAAQDALLHVRHALGPEPVEGETPHAERRADLEVYPRQHRAERDDLSLVSRVRDSSTKW